MAVTKNPCHGKLGVVIENPRRNATKILEGADVGFERGPSDRSSSLGWEESFRRLSRKGLNETIVRVRQIEGHEVRLLLDAGNHHQRFAEIGLRLARRMAERHEHLLTAELGGAHIVLHDRVTARVVVLGAKPLEDPLGRVPFHPSKQRSLAGDPDCLRGRCLSSSRIASMTPCHGPSFGRRTGFCR